MTTSQWKYLALAAIGAAGGCSDNKPSSPGTAPDTGTPPDVGTAPAGGIAVLSSDFVAASSLSLLDRNGQLVNDGCFHSGSRTPGLSQVLSGDVVLPSQPQPGHEVVLVDRGNAVLTWLDPNTCAPLRQLSVGTGYASNPHDIVAVTAQKAYVTRWDQNGNATPNPNDFDDGDDLLIVDPIQAVVTGRIALTPFAPQVAGATIMARPDRALLIEGKVFVSLNALSLHYIELGAPVGPGRVVVVDPATDSVTGSIDIPDRKNCGAMTYLDASKTLLVVCMGSWSDADPAASSGVVAIDLSVAPPMVKTVIAPTVADGRQFSATALAALSPDRVFVIAMGTYDGLPPDTLWSFSLTGGSGVKVLDSSKGITFGDLLADIDGQRIFLADGSNTRPLLRSFAVTAAGVTESAPVNVNPSVGLPPRSLAWY
jgi:hypothetical protein